MRIYGNTRLHVSAKIKRQQAEMLTLGSKVLGLCSRLIMAQKEIEDQARIDVKNQSGQASFKAQAAADALAAVAPKSATAARHSAKSRSTSAA
jgi:hypothetical protein